MGPVVVALDVASDARSRLFDRLVLRSPDLALLQLAEPRLDERLRLGVAVAAPAMGDPEALDVAPTHVVHPGLPRG